MDVPVEVCADIDDIDKDAAMTTTAEKAPKRNILFLSDLGLCAASPFSK
jgi:hypothetical protein